MKTFKSISWLLLICFLELKIVSSTPQLYKAADGKEYFIETELKYNWQQASNECARRNSQLVVINSADKNNAIIDLLKKVIGKPQNLWLGGNDEFSQSRDYNRPFFWSPTGKRFTFTYWSQDNPDNFRKREHCVHIWDVKPLYEWNDNDCTRNMGFICEVNHFENFYNQQHKEKCQVLQQSSSAVSVDYNQAQKQHLSVINSKIQSINRVGANWKNQLQQLQNTTLASIQHILEEEQVMAKQLSEKLLQQVNDLSVQLKRSVVNTNTQFGKKLNAKINEVKKIC